MEILKYVLSQEPAPSLYTDQILSLLSLFFNTTFEKNLLTVIRR